MNGANKNKPVITRAPPPVPKDLPRITDDLFLIDFSDTPPQKEPEENNSFEQLMINQQYTSPPIIQPISYPSPVTQPRFSHTNNVTDPHQFVAKVVTGVTEQLKNDFPRLNSTTTTTEITPPLVRRFTIPYPSTYYNLHRPQ